MRSARDRVRWMVLTMAVLLSLLSAAAAEAPGATSQTCGEFLLGLRASPSEEDFDCGPGDYLNTVLPGTPPILAAVGDSPSAPRAIGVRLLSGNTSHGLELEVSLPGTEAARVEVFDVMGRRVAEQRLKPVPAGFQRVSLNRGKLASGVYWARVRQGTHTARTQIVLLR